MKEMERGEGGEQNGNPPDHIIQNVPDILGKVYK
jgi:hypothetical protein